MHGYAFFHKILIILKERQPTRSSKDSRYIVYFLSVRKCPFTKKSVIKLPFHVLFAKVLTA